MDLGKTCFIFIGFQNDYFRTDGILRSAIEEGGDADRALERSVALLDRLVGTEALLVTTPIIFTEGYTELSDPTGILKTIRDCEAFKAGTRGASTVDELLAFGDRLAELPGKRGLNAFSNTGLADLLKESQVEDVVLAGAVTSICIDSTGRAAHDMGYRVSILSDCTVGRSRFEQDYYCTESLPLYADVRSSTELLDSLGLRD